MSEKINEILYRELLGKRKVVWNNESP